MGLPPTMMGLVGPSPTLGFGFLDSDILFNFPPIMVTIPGEGPFPIGQSYVDAYSVDHGPFVPYFGAGTMSTVRFSIDRMTTGMPGTASLVDPGMDYALFSLSPGSMSVGMLAPGPMWPGSPGDILFTDFTGNFFIYIHSTDLGLANLFDPMCINVDALEIY